MSIVNKIDHKLRLFLDSFKHGFTEMKKDPKKWVKKLWKSIKLSKENKRIAVVFSSLTVFILAFTIYAGQTDAFANEYYWVIKAGDEEVLAVDSIETAETIVKEFPNRYLTKGSTVNSVECEPGLVAEEKIIEQGDPAKEDNENYFTDAKKAMDFLSTGTKEPTIYKVKNGDIAWNIAEDNGFTIKELEKMNPNLNLEKIHKGTKIKLYKIKPVVKVKTVEVITSTIKTKNKTKYIKTSSLLKGQTKVKKSGRKGEKIVTATYTKVNGKTVKKDVISSKTIKKPKTRVVYKGTKTVSPSASYYADGRTYSGSGGAVASFALRFVGYPYVYGGSSLTHGADCSGFVMAVYNHFGISLPHGASSMRSYGRSVSLSEAKPGDIVCYSYHVAIYIGGGRVVHARNEALGIQVSSVSIGQSIVCVRRIFD